MKKFDNKDKNTLTPKRTIDSLKKRVTLAANEGKSPKTMKINHNNSSVNSFYSSLGSVNIENYYLHKKEKSYADIEKILNEKGWDDDIIRDILKLLRSYMDVEISNKNWIRSLIS